MRLRGWLTVDSLGYFVIWMNEPTRLDGSWSAPGGYISLKKKEIPADFRDMRYRDGAALVNMEISIDNIKRLY